MPEDVMPEGNPLLECAWHDFVIWCFGQKAYTDTYERETGRKIVGRTLLDRMIDGSTGAEDDMLFDFVRHVTEKEWGMEYAPRAFWEECERRDAAARQ